MPSGRQRKVWGSGAGIFALQPSLWNNCPTFEAPLCSGSSHSRSPEATVAARHSIPSSALPLGLSARNARNAARFPPNGFAGNVSRKAAATQEARSYRGIRCIARNATSCHAAPDCPLVRARRSLGYPVKFFGSCFFFPLGIEKIGEFSGEFNEFDGIVFYRCFLRHFSPLFQLL